MLKKIAVADLRLGMFLNAVEGSWMDHGLWRSRFLIDDPERLALVRRSGAKDCWIDTDKGIDLSAPAAPAAPSAPVVQAAPPAPAPAAPQPEEAPASFESETDRARRICDRAKGVVRDTMADIRKGVRPDLAAMEPVVDDIVAAVLRNATALISLARLKTPDDYTYMHSVAVCALMVALGKAMGFDLEACRAAGHAGLLHDMGKARTPVDILYKPGKLSDEEFAVMRAHPRLGHTLLVEAGVTDSVALDVCLHHHEKVDGSGYPDRLAGDAISLMARMGAICDVYDAVTSSRPYKTAWDPADALSQMASWKGHFDQKVFAGFIKTVGLYPAGSLVRLHSGRLAVVVGSSNGNLRAPLVNVFFSTKSEMGIPVELVDLSHARTNDRIVAREPRARWNFPHLEQLWQPAR